MSNPIIIWNSSINIYVHQCSQTKAKQATFLRKFKQNTKKMQKSPYKYSLINSSLTAEGVSTPRSVISKLISEGGV